MASTLQGSLEDAVDDPDAPRHVEGWAAAFLSLVVHAEARGPFRVGTREARA